MWYPQEIGEKFNLKDPSLNYVNLKVLKLFRIFQIKTFSFSTKNGWLKNSQSLQQIKINGFELFLLDWIEWDALKTANNRLWNCLWILITRAMQCILRRVEGIVSCFKFFSQSQKFLSSPPHHSFVYICRLTVEYITWCKFILTKNVTLNFTTLAVEFAASSLNYWLLSLFMCI